MRTDIKETIDGVNFRRWKNGDGTIGGWVSDNVTVEDSACGGLRSCVWKCKVNGQCICQW